MPLSSSIHTPASTSSKLPGSTVSDTILLGPPADAVSEAAFSPTSSILAAGSWDGKLHLYDLQRSTNGASKAIADFGAPVLSCHWNKTGNLVLGSSADKTARVVDLNADPTASKQVAQHAEPIRSARFISLPSTGHDMVVTGSWDGTIRYWDLRMAASIGKHELGGKVWAMDARGDYLVVATSAGKIQAVDLHHPMTLLPSLESSLHGQIRSLSIFHDNLGFAYASTEGRAAWMWRDPAQKLNNATFKCHRQNHGVGVDKRATHRLNKGVFPVNAVSMHPKKHTLSTAGGDGSFHYWNLNTKTRVKSFDLAAYQQPGGGKDLPQDGEVRAITATAFSSDGELFAYVIGYDWSQGFQASKMDQKREIRVHRVGGDCD